jgi:predicted permease
VTLIALTIVMAVAVGVGLARYDQARAKRVSRVVLRSIIYVLIPPVAFFNIARLDVTTTVGAQIAVGLLAVTATGLLGYVLARRVFGLEHPAAATLGNAGLASSATYLGLPMVTVLFGTRALGQAVIYSQLINAPALYFGAFGLAAVVGTRSGKGWRERSRSFVIRNPPLLAVLAGVISPRAVAPEALVGASHVLMFACLPLGFFAVGVTLAEEHGNDRLRLSSALTGPVLGALLLRLVVGPLLLVGLFALAFMHLPTSFVLLAAMPVAVNTLAVAHEYGLDQRMAASCIAWSTAIFLAVVAASSLYADGPLAVALAILLATVAAAVIVSRRRILALQPPQTPALADDRPLAAGPVGLPDEAIYQAQRLRSLLEPRRRLPRITAKGVGSRRRTQLRLRGATAGSPPGGPARIATRSRVRPRWQRSRLVRSWPKPPRSSTIDIGGYAEQPPDAPATTPGEPRHSAPTLLLDAQPTD